MKTDCTFGCVGRSYRVLGEVRTSDSGKLLFQVADNGSEAVILLHFGPAFLFTFASF